MRDPLQNRDPWYPPGIIILDSREVPDKSLQCVEHYHDIIEIDPAVPVEVKGSDRFIVGYPVHLVEEEDYVVEIQNPIAVDILIEPVVVEVPGGGYRRGYRLHRRDDGRDLLCTAESCGIERLQCCRVDSHGGIGVRRTLL